MKEPGIAMAKGHDIEADMEPVDAQRLQRFRALTETRRGTVGAGTDREPDPQLTALVARSRDIKAEGAAPFGTHFELTVEPNGTGMTPRATPRVTASLKDAVAEFKSALREPSVANNAAVRRAVEREYQLTKRDLEQRVASNDFDGDDRYAPGPVAAILLDPDVPRLTDDALATRVVQLLATTKPQTTRRGRRALYIATGIAIPICVMAIYVAGARPVGVMAIVGMATMLYGLGSGGRAQYPRLDLEDACALAYLRSNASSLSKGSALTPWPVDGSSPSGQRDVASAVYAPIKDSTQPNRAPKAARLWLRQSVRAVPQDSAAARERRVAEVHAAVAELDTEWLEYRLDIHAWFLSKPQLRNDSDPVIAAYRQAHAELRDLAEDLTSLSTDTQIATAQQAARRALTAWGDANTYALEVGVSDLSPSEEAALKQLNGLVNTLNDRSTPKHQWAQLKDAIIRNMDKLVVTSFELNVIADLPIIAEESRLQALPAARGDKQQ
jgi:hypothetical protein